MRKINIIIPVLILILFSACKDFLEELPESQLAPETFYVSEDNVEIAVNGVYDVLGQRFQPPLNPFLAFGNYHQGLLCMGLNGTDQFRSAPPANAGQRFHQLDIFAHTPSSELPTHVYTLHYIGINRANSVIANATPLLGTGLDDDRLNQSIAEAKFLRALYYFNLVRFYGGVPLKLTESASLTDTEVSEISRNTVLEVYEQIERDLLDAVDHLPTRSELPVSDYGRATKTAAWAYLARFYNTWATYPLKDISKWSQAARYASEVINSGEHMLLEEFSEVFTVENEGNDELIFVVKHPGMDDEGTSNGAFHGITGFGGGTGGGVLGLPTSGGAMRMEWGFLDSYDMLDQRRDWTIPPFKVNRNGEQFPFTEADRNNARGTLGFGKFRRDGTFVGFAQPIDFPLLRYADVLLMYAEATANEAVNPTAESYDAINQVRRRAFRGDTSFDYAGLTLEEFNDAILRERSWELAGEDCSRWHDLVRYEILGEVVTSTKRTQVLDRFDEDKHKLFPIPQTVIDSNPLINVSDQNPGY